MKRINLLKRAILAAVLGAAVSFGGAPAAEAAVPAKPPVVIEEVTARDFATFAVPDSVKLYSVSFSNQYGMKIAGNLFLPEKYDGKLPAIVIGHPMGAAKEQASCVYGAALAAKGFATLAVDQLFWGESGGIPRHAIAPDLYAETFCAAVDFLGTRDFIDCDRIGILGICGSGSFVISAAKIDPRMKAIATVSIMGEKAHSRQFTEDAYAKAAEPKELVIIPAAGHFDLYDKPEFTPIDKLADFFGKNL